MGIASSCGKLIVCHSKMKDDKRHDKNDFVDKSELFNEEGKRTNDTFSDSDNSEKNVIKLNALSKDTLDPIIEEGFRNNMLE